MTYLVMVFIFKMATRRIQKELKDWTKSPVEGVEIHPNDNDIFTWKVFLTGPKDTPYEVTNVKHFEFGTVSEKITFIYF